jgi:hypothetical protein
VPEPSSTTDADADKSAQRLRQAPPQPDPPSASDAARIVDGAFTVDDDWALRPATLKDEEPVMRQRLGQFVWCEAASYGFL